MRLIGLISSLLVFNFLVSGQEDTESQALKEIKFVDGIFMSFDQVKNNSPVPKSRLITSTGYNDRDFFYELTKSKTISFFDSYGTKQTVETKKIWGYSNNGILFIYLNGTFNRITFVGSISHFVANLTTYNNNYYDPYYYNSYYYRNRYPYYPNDRQTELRQYILDFETGKVYDYDEKSVSILLMKDPELHDEYEALRRKKKKQLKFYYIRKYNERNPLDINN